MAVRERNRRILLDLVRKENSLCADCRAPDPDWGCYQLGVFVCLNCSVVHCKLFDNRVRSLVLDLWEDDLVEFMRSRGNSSVAAVYEKDVPSFYYRPQPDDCSVVKEQWIRAKYERREFTGEVKYPPLSYTTGFYEGVLWKKGRDKTQYQQRKFVLSEREFSLMYFNREDESKGPKAVIPVKDLNASFQPEKIGHPNGLQITFQRAEHTRNIYVYHECPVEIVIWYNAIRATRYAYLKTAYPTGSDEELIPKITRNNLKEGFMEKTGPLKKEPFKKRWFILDSPSRKLFYYRGPLEAEELGLIYLGSEASGYSARRCVPRNAVGNKWKHGLLLGTPDREFLFTCHRESEQKEWLDAIRKVLVRPMEPQDYSIEASVTCKK